MKDRVTLEARGVSKRYPGTLALDNVDFETRAGQVTALIGENGAGKSTLVKILGGIELPTSGSLLMDGRAIHMRSVRDADAFGIGMIHQELNLCGNLSVTENIFLGREMTARGVLNRQGQEAIARELMSRLGQSVDVSLPAGDLPLGIQQIVEIAKALSRNVKVLMMDEPTSALSVSEIEVLFRIIRELSAQGVAIVYISHRLEELLEIADRVVILRDGRMVASAAASDVDTAWIVEQMTGRVASMNSERHLPPAGPTALRTESLSLTASSGRNVLNGVSFSAQASEILGIYGLMGSGRTELLETLMGLHPESSGEIWLHSKAMKSAGVPERIAEGMAMLPEDRKTAGLFASLSVTENMTLASLSRFARTVWLSLAAERLAAEKMVADFRIKAPGLNHNIGSLSGGNQQKVLLARCLLTSPNVLLLDEPTRGVDVGAKREIYAIVRQLAEKGMCIVFVSSELEEIRLVADRIIVMSRGEITGEFVTAETGADALALAASGYPNRDRSEFHGNRTN